MIKKLYTKGKTILEIFQEHRLSASAAHAAFFMILSLIPCIILLFSLLQFTSIKKVDVLVMVQNMVPNNMLTFVTGIVGEAYSKTATTISVSALAAVWSAGRGMMALTQGLQWVAGIKETRNYFAVRIRATLYTIVLLLSVIVFLLLGVFGDALLSLITVKIPITIYVAELIISVKNIFLPFYAIVVFALMYRFVSGSKEELNDHIPGAVLVSIGWMIFSHAFSMYIEKFNGFSDMYGSLTTIILLMLWLYFAMYIVLIGAEVNQLMIQRREKT